MSAEEQKENEADDSALESLVSIRMISYERASGPSPQDYRMHVDEVAVERAQGLLLELTTFAARSNKDVKFTIEHNKVSGAHEKGPSLDITCYANEIYDIDRWPNGFNAEGRIVVDAAWDVDSEVTIMLACRFVLQGDLEE